MIPLPLHLSRDSSNVMPRKCSPPRVKCQGVSEVRQRIASALAARIQEVTVDRCRYSPSGLMLQCSGKAYEKRFFAKIFLADPYPNPDRFRGPWEESVVLNDRSRPVQDQIATEWEMTMRMRSLVGADSVPAPLGKSPADHTIVWEETCGTTMDKVARKLCHLRLREEAGAGALFRAGRWLRKLHEASAQGMQTIDISKALDLLEEMERVGRNPAFQTYIAMAFETLRASIRTTGKTTLVTPVTLTHGDFCLANLIWEQRQNRLAVVDFELSRTRPACHDLFSFISALRVRLLNPMIPKSAIASWERAFWNGYGPVSPELPIFISALASSRVFYRQFPRLLTRRKRLGWLAGVNASIYRAIFERYVISNRLGVIPRSVLLGGDGRGGPGRYSHGIKASNISEERRDAGSGF